MSRKRTYTYNVVLEDWDGGKAGELFTDKELERIDLYRIGTVRIGKRIPRQERRKSMQIVAISALVLVLEQ